MLLTFGNFSAQISKILLKLQNEFHLISIIERRSNLYDNVSDFKIKISPEFKGKIKHLLEVDEGGLDSKEIISQLEEKENKIKKLEEENKKLSNELATKEDKRIIRSLNKILCGIVKAHYKDKSSRVTKISGTILREAGIELDEKTIRTRLEEALKEDQSAEG